MKLFDIDCCAWRLRREVWFVPATPGSGPTLCDACRAALALHQFSRNDSHLPCDRDPMASPEFGGSLTDQTGVRW